MGSSHSRPRRNPKTPKPTKKQLISRPAPIPGSHPLHHYGPSPPAHPNPPYRPQYPPRNDSRYPPRAKPPTKPYRPAPAPPRAPNGAPILGPLMGKKVKYPPPPRGILSSYHKKALPQQGKRYAPPPQSEVQYMSKKALPKPPTPRRGHVKAGKPVIVQAATRRSERVVVPREIKRKPVPAPVRNVEAKGRGGRATFMTGRFTGFGLV